MLPDMLGWWRNPLLAPLNETMVETITVVGMYR